MDEEEEVKLTAKQELFVDNILQGKTQHESYLIAYPTAKKWTTNAIDVAANHMMQKPKIKARLQELGWKDKTKVLLTRERMLDRLDRVMQKHEEEMERIQEACEQEKQMVMNELSQWMQLLNTPHIDKKGVQAHINDLTQKLIDLNKRRTLNSTNTTGILKAADRINRMLGFDTTKVEITQVDSERQEMEKLTADDLKELLKLSKKEIK